MGRLLTILLLHISGGMAIFHRWYIPQKNTLSLEKPEDRLFFWRNFPTYEKRGGVTADKGKLLNDCITVSHGEEQTFTYTYNPEHRGVCGLYLIGRPDENVVVTLEEIDLSGNCESDMLVLVDGWELNGNILPSMDDHELPLKDRLYEACREENEGLTMQSSQNAAMLQFKIEGPGGRFKIRVKYTKNPEPCNVLMSEMTGIFKITNNGEERNCSVTTLLFPAKISLLEVKVGSRDQSLHKKKRGLQGILPEECGVRDFLELGGSADLNASDMETKSTVCGHNPEPAQKDLTILCESSTLRLVSSGKFRNSVTALVQEATENDLDFNENIVMKCQRM